MHAEHISDPGMLKERPLGLLTQHCLAGISPNSLLGSQRRSEKHRTITPSGRIAQCHHKTVFKSCMSLVYNAPV